MKKLIKYVLNTEIAWSFIQDNLDEANALSIELLNLFKKNEGNFFTLLPEDANLKNIHCFKYGCILSQKPIEYGPVGNMGNYRYREKSSINHELTKIIEDILIQDQNITCIIDDVIRYSTDKKMQEGRDELKDYTAYSGRDVYYLINKHGATSSLIFECLRRNRGYWHALSILSKVCLKGYIGKQLDKEILTQICKNAQMIMIGAYDGEGYVFWEKNDSYIEALVSPSIKIEKRKDPSQNSLKPDSSHNHSNSPHWDYEGPDFKNGVKIYPNET